METTTPTPAPSQDLQRSIAQVGQQFEQVVANVERVILKHEGDREYKGCLALDTHPKPAEGETSVGIPFDPRLLYTEPWFSSIRAGKKWGREVGVEVLTEDEAWDYEESSA